MAVRITDSPMMRPVILPTTGEGLHAAKLLLSGRCVLRRYAISPVTLTVGAAACIRPITAAVAKPLA